MTHSPAPWKAHRGVFVKDAGGQIIASTFSFGGRVPKDVEAANLRMLVASPALLGIVCDLRDLLMQIEPREMSNEESAMLARCVEAIAQAENEQ